MSEAAPAPPRKPSSARRWVWAHAVLLALYVAGYGCLRASGRLEARIATHQIDGVQLGSTCWIGDAGSFDGFTGRHRVRVRRSWLMRLYLPGIAVEEWWRNR